MGACCNSNFNILYYEDSIREIISDMKICNLKYDDFKSRLFKIMKKKLIMKKDKIEEYLVELFLEVDLKKNKYYNIHKSFFDEIFYWLRPEVGFYEILLFVFPLLVTNKGDEQHDFGEILTNFYKSDYFSLSDLYVMMLKSFELYTFKLNKIIQSHNEDRKTKLNLTIVINDVFSFNKINAKINSFFYEYKDRKKDEKNIYIDDIKQHYKSKKIFTIWDIREYMYI